MTPRAPSHPSSAGRSARAPSRPGAEPQDPAHALAEPLSLGAPAFLTTLLVAAACVLLSVTFVLRDPEIWQHLAIGRAIGELHHVPVTQIWTWPSYGAPDVLTSWGFDAILYPLWSLAGVWGLFLLRWLSALATFGLLFSAARRLGTRGLAPLVVLVVAALSYREHAQVRPELFAALFLALEIWILETRRRGGPDRALALIPIGLAWANLHLTWVLGPLVAIAYLLDDLRGESDGTVPRSSRRLGLALAGMIAAAFLNPFGWNGVWQPFALAQRWGGDPIVRSLGGAAWYSNWGTLLPVLVVGWPGLIVARARRHGWDVAEVVIAVALTCLVVVSTRFAGLYAVAAAPFVARGLDAALTGIHPPAWARDPWRRAAIACVCCVAVGLFQWTRPDPAPGIGLGFTDAPVKACDFMAERGIKGRGFNHLQVGGYLLHRFWPDRERLPFTDTRQSGTPEQNRLYARAFTDPGGWKYLDDSYRFDYALLDASQEPAEADWLRDRLDADSAWVLVFLDDAGALFVRRSGAYSELARRDGYFAIPAGERRLDLIGQAVAQDTVMRSLTRFELERQIRESPYNARAHSMLANVAIAENRFDVARQHLEAALRQSPRIFAAHERLGMMALAAGRSGEAVKEFEREMKLTGGTSDLRARLEQAKLLAKNPGAAPPR